MSGTVVGAGAGAVSALVVGAAARDEDESGDEAGDEDGSGDGDGVDSVDEVWASAAGADLEGCAPSGSKARETSAAVAAPVDALSGVGSLVGALSGVGSLVGALLWAGSPVGVGL
jgi:hypothetical protein